MFVVLLFADDRHPLAPLSVGIGKSIPHSGGRVKGHSAGVISVTPVRRAGSVSWTAAAVMATRSPTARAGRLATPSRGTSTRTAMPASGSGSTRRLFSRTSRTVALKRRSAAPSEAPGAGSPLTSPPLSPAGASVGGTASGAEARSGQRYCWDLCRTLRWGAGTAGSETPRGRGRPQVPPSAPTAPGGGSRSSARPPPGPPGCW